jgi:hypothetical protein
MGRAYAESSERLGHFDAAQYQNQADWFGGDSQQRQFASYWQQAAWEEASRLADAERQRLESELQAKLDVVAMDLDAIESINRATVRGLRFKVFLFFVLALGIAGGAGYYYTKKLRPQVAWLQALVTTQNNEQARFERELRDKAESTRVLQQKYDALVAELDRLRGGKGATAKPAADLKAADAKPVDAKAADARPVDAKAEAKPAEAKPAEAKPAEAKPAAAKPAAAVPPPPTTIAPVTAPQAQATQAAPSSDIKPAMLSTPKPDARAATRTAPPPQAKTAPAVVVRKVKPRVCNCDPGDPMCGCIP